MFISYSHKDRERILRIITTLYESGWKIWYDEGLTIGDRYDETLERHVRNCAAFLLFITEHSPESKYIIENEIPWAIRYGKPIIKCILDEGNDHEIGGGDVIATVSRTEIEPALEKVGELTKGERREAQGISVIVNPDARETASGKGFAYCLYSKESTSLPQTILLEAKYSGCVFYDAARDGEDTKKLKESACVIVFLDKAFLEDQHLMEILIREYQAGRNLAVCKTGEFKDSELPEELISLRKMQWLNFVHGITTDMNTKLAQHLQKSGCRNTAILPGFEYEETDRGIVITGYTGTNPNPRINIAADEIAEGAFDGCNRLQSFEIPDGVRKIGDGAFKNCTSLASVTIPDGVEQIGKEAFYGCENLTSITIPDSVTKIGVRVFCRCTNLASAVLSGSLKELEQEAFSRCSSLTSIMIPDGVTEIGRAAFRNCESLAAVTIPNSATRIGIGAFSDCKSLTSIIIPAGVTEIGRSAFSNCESLASVTIPNSVAKIGRDAFSDCKNLTSVNIPDSVTEVENGAFNGCEKLADSEGFVIVRGILYAYCGNRSDVIIPRSVSIIDGQVFRESEILTSVQIPYDLTEIKEQAFHKCRNLKWVRISGSVKKIGSEAFRECLSLTSIVIPNGITEIEESVFCNCQKLESIAIPDSVTKIGDNAFLSCKSLRSVVIPDGVTEIGKSAFFDCTNLESIAIPGSVTKIGDGAFSNCIKLADDSGFVIFNGVLYSYQGKENTVTVPEDVTKIALGAFAACTNLTSVTLPDSVTEIGSFAFYKCDGLTSVNIPDGVTKIGEVAFEGCTGITAICTPGSRSWKYCEDNGIPVKAKDSPSPRRLGFFRRIFGKK